MANDAILCQPPQTRATTANEAAALVFPKVAQHFNAFWEKEAEMTEAPSIEILDLVDEFWALTVEPRTEARTARWRFPEFERQVRVKSSHRLTYALRRADVRRWLVTLNEVRLLEQNRARGLSPLGHDAAHIAAFRRHGVSISRHDPESGSNPPLCDIFSLDKMYIIAI